MANIWIFVVALESVCLAQSSIHLYFLDIYHHGSVLMEVFLRGFAVYIVDLARGLIS